MSTPREIQAGVPQGSVVSPALYSMYKSEKPKTPGVYFVLFANGTCMYSTYRQEGYVLRKQQRGLNSIETWCKGWNIKIDEDKTRVVYFAYRFRPPEAHLTLSGRNILFVNHEITSV
jgi:hypothetical protein